MPRRRHPASTGPTSLASTPSAGRHQGDRPDRARHDGRHRATAQWCLGMLGLVLSRLGAVIGAGALAVGGVTAAPAALGYRSATYAAALQFSGVSISARGLGLYGTATIASNQGVDCLEADVNPTTLVLSDIFEPRCDDPRMSGHQVVPVEATVDKGNYISVRVARVDPATGHIEVGPVLGTDEDASDTRPQWVYGAGSLWLYLAAPKGSPAAGKALRVSVVTGQLVQTTEVSPGLFRPVMAADANGLYLSPAVNGGFQASPGTANAVIFHVGLGATKSDVFYRWPAGKWYGFADWMSGYGDQLSADICQRGGSALKCVLAGFEGTSARADLLSAEPYFDGWAVGGPVPGSSRRWCRLAKAPRRCPQPSSVSTRPPGRPAASQRSCCRPIGGSSHPTGTRAPPFTTAPSTCSVLPARPTRPRSTASLCRRGRDARALAGRRRRADCAGPGHGCPGGHTRGRGGYSAGPHVSLAVVPNGCRRVQRRLLRQ